jgi:hypothetical protein
LRAFLKIDSVAKAALFGFFVIFIFAANKKKKISFLPSSHAIDMVNDRRAIEFRTQKKI